MALVGSFITCTSVTALRPLLRTTSPGQPGLILLSCGLSHCLSDGLTGCFLKILAEADQISQHFVRYGFMRDRGMTSPLPLVMITATHQKSEFVSNYNDVKVSVILKEERLTAHHKQLEQ